MAFVVSLETAEACIGLFITREYDMLLFFVTKEKRVRSQGTAREAESGTGSNCHIVYWVGRFAKSKLGSNAEARNSGRASEETWRRRRIDRGVADITRPVSTALANPARARASALRLAAPGNASVGARSCSTCMAISKCVRTLAEAPLRLTNRGDRLILHLNKGGRRPTAPLRHRLLVCGQVESDEEEQVRCYDTDSGDSGEFLAGASAGVGEPGPVGASEVGPRCEVDEA